MPRLSKTDEADLLLRVLECAIQSNGWASILDSIDLKLNCISFLCEFEKDGAPTRTFDGGRSSGKLRDMLFSEPVQHADEAFRFLLTEAELRYPYCKTTLRKGDFGGNNPVGHSEPGTNGRHDFTRKTDASGLIDTDAEPAETAGLISPLMRGDRSTILFGCLFKEHTTETIDVEVAHETFRTLTRLLTPGIDAYFKTEHQKTKNRIQDVLLMATACPSVLMSEDKILLGQAASGFEKLLATGSVRFNAPRFEFKNKKLEAGLQDVLDAFRNADTFASSRERSESAKSPPGIDHSVFLEDGNGRLKRITINAVPATGVSEDSGSALWIVLKIYEASNVPETVETVLQERFELSHSEAHLARHLTMSGSMNDTVQELGITRNTAKTHLRRIFEKTGVNTQLQLARLVHGISSLF